MSKRRSAQGRRPFEKQIASLAQKAKANKAAATKQTGPYERLLRKLDDENAKN